MLVYAFNILLEHDNCIHGMLLLLHVDLDVCIANKGEKIEHKFRGVLHCFAFEHIFERGRKLQRGEICLSIFSGGVRLDCVSPVAFCLYSGGVCTSAVL